MNDSSGYEGTDGMLTCNLLESMYSDAFEYVQTIETFVAS